jgi:hypothetical protein
MRPTPALFDHSVMKALIGPALVTLATAQVLAMKDNIPLQDLEYPSSYYQFTLHFY